MDTWEEKSSLLDPQNERGDVVGQVQPARKNTSSRVLFTLLSVGMLVVLLVSFVALGSFGKKQRDITNFYRGYNTQGNCILYSKYLDQKPDKTVIISLDGDGPCAFVLWGLVSVSIAVVSTVIYLVLLTILGTKILSPLRILDLVVSLSVFLASLVISITITAGINRTCAAADRTGHLCAATVLLHPGSKDGEELFFYDAITVAKNSSWAVTLLLLFMTLWNVFMVIAYCLQKRSNNRATTII